MRPIRFLTLGALYFALTCATASVRGETNWPRWRGPLENGHTTQTDLPVTWTADDGYVEGARAGVITAPA